MEQGSSNIEGEGIVKFYQAINVDPMDPLTLYISLLMKAECMGEYQYQEFEKLCIELGVDSVEGIKAKVPTLRRDQHSHFKEIYKFTFDFSRDKGFKNVVLETAIALWQLLLADKCKFLNKWCAFIEKEGEGGLKVIPKDTWNMLLELNEATRGDMANFVDDGAWPVLIDKFQEFLAGH